MNNFSKINEIKFNMNCIFAKILKASGFFPERIENSRNALTLAQVNSLFVRNWNGNVLYLCGALVPISVNTKATVESEWQEEEKRAGGGAGGEAGGGFIFDALNQSCS